MAATWALSWAVASLLLGPHQGLRSDVLGTAWSLVRVGAIKGALSGAVFALLLAWLERRQRIATLSAPRLALWGGVAGVLWTLALMGASLVVNPGWRPGPNTRVTLLNQGMFATLSALASLWLARRGDRRALNAPSAHEVTSGPRAAGALPGESVRSAPRADGRLRDAVT
jgi:hypothetical protein